MTGAPHRITRNKKTGLCTVWVLKENYCGQVRGGLSKSWAWVKKNLTEQEALQLYSRRVGEDYTPNRGE